MLPVSFIWSLLHHNTFATSSFLHKEEIEISFSTNLCICMCGGGGGGGVCVYTLPKRKEKWIKAKYGNWALPSPPYISFHLILPSSGYVLDSKTHIHSCSHTWLDTWTSKDENVFQHLTFLWQMKIGFEVIENKNTFSSFMYSPSIKIIKHVSMSKR